MARLEDQPLIATIVPMPENYDAVEAATSQGTKNYSVPKIQKRGLTILFGQVISLLAASSNAASFTLQYGMDKVFPAFLMLIVYSILGLYLFSRPAIKDDQTAYRIPSTSIKIRAPWWQYICLSALDILPNYFTLISLQLTSLTSANLLGSLTVPSTMLVCNLVLSKKYQAAHFIGALLCVIGGAMTLLADFDHSTTYRVSSPSHPHSYFGDMLAILAAILYGIGDAASEYWTKHVDRKEYLGMIGLHGAIVSLILSLLFERDAISNAFAGETFVTISTVVWYILSVVFFYVLATLFLVSSDATLLNLSLQASNLWAVLFAFVAFRETPSFLFSFAVIFVAAGVSVYELLGNASQESTKEEFGPDDYI